MMSPCPGDIVQDSGFVSDLSHMIRTQLSILRVGFLIPESISEIKWQPHLVNDR